MKLVGEVEEVIVGVVVWEGGWGGGDGFEVDDVGVFVVVGGLDWGEG